MFFLYGGFRPLSNRFSMQKENWRCLDSWVEALRLGLERQTDIKPIQIQIKIAVAWIPQRELSGLFVCPSDSVFWIRVPRPILNRYRTQSKHWCCLDSSDLLVCSADSVFWKGVSRPISNRYRIQRENGFCLDYRVCESSQTCFHDLQIRCSGWELQTDTKPIQNPK